MSTEKDGKKELGLKLKACRKEKGISIVQMAKMLGVTRQTIGNIENGKTGIVNPNIKGYLDYFDFEVIIKEPPVRKEISLK